MEIQFFFYMLAQMLVLYSHNMFKENYVYIVVEGQSFLFWSHTCVMS